MSDTSAGGSSAWKGRSRPRAAPAGKLGRFELLAAVGRGAFGEVWRAYDPHLDREVALKLPRFDDTAGKEAQRFFREARAAAQLQHPHIVPVHEAGEVGGRCYIASKFIDGLPLSAWARQNAVPPRQAAALVRKLAEALHYAHGRGIIHRDVKPANVMIDAAGEPHLMDFGLARRPDDEATLTTEGSVLGTPSYMAPEQALGRSHQVDARSDLYALGVVLYELLAGKKPFDGPPHAVLHQVVHDEPPPIRKAQPKVPADLETICRKCLEKAPVRRYADCAALAEDLRRFLAREPILARPVGPLGRAWRWCARNPVLAGGGVALAVAGLLVVGLLVALAASLGRRPDAGTMSASQAAVPSTSSAATTSRVTRPSRPAVPTSPAAPAATEEIRRLTGHTGPIWSLAVSADGRRAVTCAGVKWLAGGQPFDPGDHTVRAWDLTTNQLLWTFTDHTDTPRTVDISPDGKRAISGGFDNTVRVWDLERGKLVHTLTGHTNKITGVALVPGSNRAVSVAIDGVLRVWDLDAGDSYAAFPLGLGPLHCVTPAPTGDRVYCGTQDQGIREVELKTGRPGRRFDGLPEGAYQIALSPDGKYIAAGSPRVNGALWSLADGSKLADFEGHAVRFTADSRRLLTGGRDFSLRLWDVADRREIARLPGHTDHPQGLAILPGGTRALSAAWDNTLRLWRLPGP